MQDQETESDWSHILGTAMAGDLKGTKLAIIPSTMTDWQTWLEMHPETTATRLERTAGEFVTGRIFRLNQFGLGLVHQGQARFWRFDLLAQQPVVNDRFEDLALVVYFEPESRTPTAWESTLDGQQLTFRQTAAGIEDSETKSTWDLLKGRATAGPLAGKTLKAVPAIVSFTNAWARFHPESTHWEPPKSSP